MKAWIVAGVIFVLMLLEVALSVARAEPVVVQFTEGVTRGFPVLRALSGEKLAQGDLSQVSRGDQVESRLRFRFGDGSLYDETVVFSQRGVFTLLSYRLVQQGPSFPETIEAAIDRDTGQYTVRYRADEDSPEETIAGHFELPADVYNGMLGTLMKNLAPAANVTLQIVAFTPKPRLVKLRLVSQGPDEVLVADQLLTTRRYLVKPELGLLASLLIMEPAPIQCWIVDGPAPGFLRFQGPLYFLGPVWRIELN